LSKAPPSDPKLAVLIDYCEALRDILRADGISPFKLAGLKLYDELQQLEASLRRCQKRGNIHFCPPYLKVALRGRAARSRGWAI